MGMYICPPVHCLSTMPKNTCSSMPSQNTGTDTSTDVESVTRTSRNEYCLTAEMMPAAIPTMISMMIAAKASLTVYGYFSPSMSLTARPVSYTHLRAHE